MKLVLWFSGCAIVAILAMAFSGAFRRPVPETIAMQVAKDTDLVPATTADVNRAVERVFGEDVVVEGDGNPVFMSTDLNGDGVSDLAVVVTARPGKIDELGSQFANWSVQDVSAVEFASVTKGAAKATFVPRRKETLPQLKPNERLLAVIHGHGDLGWRDAEARQAFLLVNAEAERMSRADFVELKRQGIALPRMSANPTRALLIEFGKQSFAVYWAGAQYAAVKTKPELLASKLGR